MKKISITSHKINNLNTFIFLYLFSYIAGPAVINIYLTLISLYSLFYLYKNKDKIKELKKDKPFIFFSTFFLYILLKDIFQNNFNSEFLAFLRIYFVFTFICFYSLINKVKIQISFISIAILFLILNLDSIFQYIFEYNLIGYKIFDSYRLTSFFKNEPIIGSFLMKLFFPLFIFYLYKDKKDIFTFFVIVITIIIISLSGERMPFLQLVFGLTITFLFFHKFTKKTFLYILSTIFLIISVLFISPSSFDRYKDTFSSIGLLLEDIKNDRVISNSISNNSIYTYILNFNSGILLWQKEPLLGNGFRHYKNNCKKSLIKSHAEGCSTHPHNIYIEILSDYGIFGLIFFISFLVSSLFSFLKNKTNKKYLGIFITVVITSVPFVTSQSIFSSYYGSIYFFYIFLMRYYTESK